MKKEIKAAEELLTAKAYRPIKYKEPDENAHADEEGITSGILILPPLNTQTNPEMDSYPDDYIEYAQGRLRDYKAEHGEFPKWKTDHSLMQPPEEEGDEDE